MQVQNLRSHQQALQALAQSEQRFRRFFEKSTSVMLLIEPQNGRILGANEAAVNFYGCPLASLLTMSMTQINALPVREVEVSATSIVEDERDVVR